MALGLGELTLESYLNEPLKAQVDLLNTGGLHEDQIRIRLATTDDFQRMGIERAYFLTSITFDVQIDDDGNASIVLTSEEPVLEPYLDFIVEARWPSGRLLREYTVLVDPPVFDQSNPVVSASARVAEVENLPAPAKKKQEAVAETGTRVDIKPGQLAPGAMPRRDFNATTSPTPVAGSRYMIHRDDTLWDIASRARPGNTSVHQTMLDIQRLNPDAFIDGNINRIKAGYIVYLPQESDISSASLAEALAEVREQNEAWRESKAAEPDYSGPSLRISAEPGEGTGGDVASAAEGEESAGTAAMEDLEKAELERVELEQRLASMEQQVETLQRIVSLKDDQIAALQGAIADQEGAAEVAAGEGLALLEGEMADGDSDSGMGAGAPAAAEEVEAAVVEEVEPSPAPVEASAPASEPASREAQGGGVMDYLWYIIGALVVAVLAFIFARRRGAADEEEFEDTVGQAAQDQFADVKLTEQTLEVEEEPAAVEPEPAPVPADTAHRGYGERKHDEYASDVDASDALAEADIYIAYGRYPQAVDLLNNALAGEPDNTEYRLKLLQIHVDTGDRDAANQQLSDLARINDPDALAEAERIMAGDAAPAPVDFTPAAASESADLLAESEAPLEADFSGLAIEEPGGDEGVEEELDLSSDFEDSDLAADTFDEELVIAAESNGMSTKLDLARAYLDMGDDDGARQILEEVAAEGKPELQAEARELLDRIG